MSAKLLESILEDTLVLKSKFERLMCHDGKHVEMNRFAFRMIEAIRNIESEVEAMRVKN